MAKRITVDEFIVQLDNIANLDVRETLTKCGLKVETSAKQNAPVDTGMLRMSITSQADDKEAIIGSNLEYAPYVEYGTGIWAAAGEGRKDRWCYQDAAGNWHSTIGQKPQPFLGPALNENRDYINEQFRTKVKEELSK